MQMIIDNQAALLAMGQQMQNLQPKKDRIGTTPDKFKGDRNDASRFWTQVSLFLQNNGHIYGMAHEWISFLFGLCVGDAGEWAQPYCEDINNNGRVPWNTWQEFEIEFKLTWFTSDVREDAHTKLRSLKQNNLDITKYTTKFQLIAGKMGYSDEDLRDCYSQGLNAKIRLTLSGWDRPMGTLVQLKAAAIKAENLESEFGFKKTSSSSSSSNNWT